MTGRADRRENRLGRDFQLTKYSYSVVEATCNLGSYGTATDEMNRHKVRPSPDPIGELRDE
jgi:hypothetical protein